jgi:nucleotide-binding universal stress UspA family protein
MEKPLIVGIDGSDPALRAIDWAVAEAAYHRVPLRLVYASLWEQYEKLAPAFATRRPAQHVLAEHIVASGAERALHHDPTVRVSTDILRTDPVSGLLAEADSAYALVVGDRGRGDITAMLLGSTGLAVAAHANCPVIVVRDVPSGAHGEATGVTLGVGAAGESSAAVAFAFREARARDVELRAVHAWNRPARELPGTGHLTVDGSGSEAHEAGRTLDDALRNAAQEYPKVTVRKEVPEGRARSALLDASATSGLLVVGARRRRGRAGMQLGPVNHAVLHHASCPVAVVPQEA